VNSREFSQYLKQNLFGAESSYVETIARQKAKAIALRKKRFGIKKPMLFRIPLKGIAFLFTMEIVAQVVLLFTMEIMALALLFTMEIMALALLFTMEIMALGLLFTMEMVVFDHDARVKMVAPLITMDVSKRWLFLITMHVSKW